MTDGAIVHQFCPLIQDDPRRVRTGCERSVEPGQPVFWSVGQVALG